MINRRNKVMVALLAVVLSSCNLYKEYENTVDTGRVDSLYNYIEATSDTTNLASMGWSELFTDPHLVDLISEGLENNTDLKVAALNIDAAEIALRTARLAYVPTLGVGLGANVSTATQPTYSFAATSSWEIDIFGKLKNAKEQSKVALEQSRVYAQSVQTALVATIATNYYSLLMLDDQLDISRRTLQAWQENIRTMKALKDAGMLNQTSVLQSEASRVALESSIVTIDEQIAALENSLSTLLGKPAEHIERGVLADANFPSELSVGVPIQLLSNRPDVMVAEYNLAQAFYATGVARSSLYPSLTLSGSAGYTTGAGVSVNPSEMIFSAAASLLQPIFNGGTLRAALEVAKLQQEQALLQFNQTVLDAGAEVNTALIQWQSAVKSLSYDTERLDYLEEALRSAELLMVHGNVNYLEVLTAQFTLLQAELTFSSDKLSEITGVIELYRALGGGVY